MDFLLSVLKNASAISPPARAVTSCGQENICNKGVVEEEKIKEEIMNKIENLIKLANIIEASLFFTKEALKIRATLARIIKGIIVAIGAGRRPFIRAMLEGKIAIRAALINPKRQAAKNKVALTIEPVIH